MVIAKMDMRLHPFSHNETVAKGRMGTAGRAVARLYDTLWPVYPSSGPSGRLVPMGEGRQTEPINGRH